MAQNNKTIAAIDIGTNSIKMSVGQIMPDGNLELLDQLQRTVHLGQDTFKRSRLGRMTMKAAIQILKEFTQILKGYSVENTWTVATSAVREAINSEIFIDRVLAATGLKVNIIGGPEESRLTVSAIRSSPGDNADILSGNVLIAEVGAGSTVITILLDGKIVNSQSLNLGAIRLQEIFTTGWETREQAAIIIHNEIQSVLESVKGVIPFEKIDKFIAVGADARFAAKVIGKKIKDLDLIQISKNKFGNLAEKIKLKTPAQLVSEYSLPISDAETLSAALLIIKSIFSMCRCNQIYVSSVSMRDGLLLELANRMTGKEDKSFVKCAMESVTAIAEKYKVNLMHARRVALICSKIFDLLSSEHGLNFKHRLLLESAAVLHEAGIYISSRSYHKHTYYLIANSEIFGLTQSEVNMIAHIARYHRRSRPKASHIEYMGLPRETRIAINKLAAILRVADAIKVKDDSQIKNMKFNITEDNIVITMSGISDALLQKRAIELKRDMFEDTYGLRLELKEN